MQEIELKLTLTHADIAALQTRPVFAELTGGNTTTHVLLSRYFDTLDGALSRARIAVRIRDDGTMKVQTVKLDGGLKKGLSQTIEYESDIAGETPDFSLIKAKKIRDRLEKALSGRPLTALFETRITRTVAMIEIEGEGAVELALDIGEVRAGRKSDPISEVELELKSGAPFVLLTVAEKLFEGIAVTPSKLHKARRGYALLGLLEEDAARDGPAYSKNIKLTARMSGMEALRAAGNAAAEQILQNWEFVLGSEATEGPHQLRVGLRRLRTALHMLDAKALAPDLSGIEKRSQKLAGVVGELRDADVLYRDIFLPAAESLPEISMKSPLGAALLAHIERKRAMTRKSLKSVDWTGLKLNCLLFDFAIDRAEARAGGDFKDPGITKHAEKALEKAWRRVIKWGARIDDLAIEERHSMRKKLKSLRYVTEFFLPLYSAKKAKPFLKKLQRLQDIFGYLNDVATSQKLLEIAEERGTENATLIRDAHIIHEWHLARADEAWRDARKSWKKLKKTPRFWE